MRFKRFLVLIFIFISFSLSGVEKLSVKIGTYENSNGRIARAMTDMSLAQDDNSSKRLYSLSSQIIKDNNNYHNILEHSQKGNGDITEWLIWFLDTFSIKQGDVLPAID